MVLAAHRYLGAGHLGDLERLEAAIAAEMRTSVSAGFRKPQKRFGQMVFAYCEDASLGCHRIQPVPLDPRSGYVNAVGSVRAVALGGIETTSFSPMGEAIFREIATTTTAGADPQTAACAH